MYMCVFLCIGSEPKHTSDYAWHACTKHTSVTLFFHIPCPCPCPSLSFSLPSHSRTHRYTPEYIQARIINSSYYLMNIHLWSFYLYILYFAFLCYTSHYKQNSQSHSIILFLYRNVKNKTDQKKKKIPFQTHAQYEHLTVEGSRNQ